MNNDTNKTVLEHLSKSQIYQDYERAFGEATGLPLTLSPVEDWHLAHHRRRHENPCCALLAKQSKTCAACLRTQQELGATAREESKTVTCFAGLCETAIPLRIGDNLIGFLRTGEVMLRSPSKRHLNRVARRLLELGLKIDSKELHEAYFHTRVLSQKQYESVQQLLRIFAQHLSIVANQLVFRTENSEPPIISRAREFIASNYTEDLSLASVAKAVHMSTFYFCKQFKKATGLNFTNYLGRVRVERAKERLLNPNVRVSEIAYEVGFQSLTHFNRVFRKLTGESPSNYRSHLPLAQAA
jgi:AraC-like DNA-binding protein/ligand-binding sensor protein